MNESTTHSGHTPLTCTQPPTTSEQLSHTQHELARIMESYSQLQNAMNRINTQWLTNPHEQATLETLLDEAYEATVDMQRVVECAGYSQADRAAIMYRAS